tara:strand:- start:13 stop:297 length:285 start_codon:yes stop_codon:yes gene_type:complete
MGREVMIIKKYPEHTVIKFSNGFKITNYFKGLYSDCGTPVFLDTAVKIRLSNRIKNDWTRINEFKTVDDALSYLKDTCKINFKTKLLNEIKESI